MLVYCGIMSSVSVTIPESVWQHINFSGHHLPYHIDPVILQVWLLGSIPELGEWNPARAIETGQVDGEWKVWQSRLRLPINASFQWSWCLLYHDGRLRLWESSQKRHRTISSFSGMLHTAWGDPTLEIFQQEMASALLLTEHRTKKGDVVAVVGSSPQLGAWDPVRAIMATEFPYRSGCWSVTVFYDPGILQEWNWIIISQSTKELKLAEKHKTRFLNENHNWIKLNVPWNKDIQIMDWSPKEHCGGGDPHVGTVELLRNRKIRLREIRRWEELTEARRFSPGSWFSSREEVRATLQLDAPSSFRFPSDQADSFDSTFKTVLTGIKPYREATTPPKEGAIAACQIQYTPPRLPSPPGGKKSEPPSPTFAQRRHTLSSLTEYPEVNRVTTPPLMIKEVQLKPKEAQPTKVAPTSPPLRKLSYQIPAGSSRSVQSPVEADIAASIEAGRRAASQTPKWYSELKIIPKRPESALADDRVGLQKQPVDSAIADDRAQKQPSSSVITDDRALKKPSSSVITDDKALKKPSSSVITDDKALKKPSSSVITDDKALKKPSSSVITDDRAQKQPSSSVINDDRALKKPSSSVITDDRALKKPSSSVITDDKALKKPSSSVITDDKALKKPSSSVITDDRAQKQPSSSVINDDRALKKPSSSVITDDRALKKPSSSVITDDKALIKSGSSVIDEKMSKKSSEGSVTSSKSGSINVQMSMSSKRGTVSSTKTSSTTPSKVTFDVEDSQAPVGSIWTGGTGPVDLSKAGYTPGHMYSTTEEKDRHNLVSDPGKPGFPRHPDRLDSTPSLPTTFAVESGMAGYRKTDDYLSGGINTSPVSPPVRVKWQEDKRKEKPLGGGLFDGSSSTSLASSVGLLGFCEDKAHPSLDDLRQLNEQREQARATVRRLEVNSREERNKTKFEQNKELRFEFKVPAAPTDADKAAADKKQKPKGAK